MKEDDSGRNNNRIGLTKQEKMTPNHCIRFFDNVAEKIVIIKNAVNLTSLKCTFKMNKDFNIRYNFQLNLINSK